MSEEYINEEKDVAQKNNVEEEGMEVSELKVYEKEAGVVSNVNNISRIITDKNGNTIVRKKLFSISVGTIVAITVAVIAIASIGNIVMAHLGDNDSKTSHSEYSSYIYY